MTTCLSPGVQAPGKKYIKPEYLTPERLSSVGWQFRLCSLTGTNSFLEIGTGQGLLAHLLRRQGYDVLTIDHNPEIHPNVVGALPDIPLQSGMAETVLCFQVLEHLPLELLSKNLEELARLSKKWIIISLPDCTKKPRLRWRFKWWIYHKFRFPSRWKHKEVKIGSEHFWEIGFQGVTASDVETLATLSGLSLTERFRNPYNPYHHFFVLKKQ